MAARRILPRFLFMNAEQPTHRVELSCVGPPPARRIQQTAGISEVVIDGPTVSCLVTGSFQPLLEALRGHEVITLQSTSAREPAPSLRSDGSL
jgi:hypothetical protein